MKQYQKAQMLAKNIPSGSYAAGCPARDRDSLWKRLDRIPTCLACERTK